MTDPPAPERRELDQTLRIGWASPLNRGSAIGRVSAEVTDALVERGHHVEVIATETHALREAPRHPTRAPCAHWSELDLTRLAEDYDLVVVNVGDHYGFHSGIFPLLAHADCLGIFHDFYLYNLFNGWLEDTAGGRTEGWRRAAHVAGVTAVYGQPLAALADQAACGAAAIETIAARMPMTEWVARRCAGALAHANFYVDRLAAACPGPVVVAGLPVSGRGVAPLAPREGPRVNLLTVGVMNPNKCAAEVIAAIAASPRLSAQVNYRLVGPIDAAERERLTSLAGSLGFDGLTIHGSVDEATLTARLEQADVICCLRRPVLEGASGSAIEGLLAGRPLIVADAGFYGELPDDVVFKTPADIPCDRLTARLEQLCGDEVLRRTAGAKGRAFAEDRFNITAYVEALEPLMWETIAARPQLELGRRIGSELSALGLAPTDAAVRRIDESVTALFSPGR